MAVSLRIDRAGFASRRSPVRSRYAPLVVSVTGGEDAPVPSPPPFLRFLCSRELRAEVEPPPSEQMEPGVVDQYSADGVGEHGRGARAEVPWKEEEQPRSRGGEHPAF